MHMYSISYQDSFLLKDRTAVLKSIVFKVYELASRKQPLLPDSSLFRDGNAIVFLPYLQHIALFWQFTFIHFKPSMSFLSRSPILVWMATWPGEVENSIISWTIITLLCYLHPCWCLNDMGLNWKPTENSNSAFSSILSLVAGQWCFICLKNWLFCFCYFLIHGEFQFHCFALHLESK